MNWIPVTEKLPETDDRVLVWLGDCTDIGIYSERWLRWNRKVQWCWVIPDGDDWSDTNQVTHWMPFPAGPPREPTPYETNV